MNNQIVSAGFDLSLSGTGVVILKDGKILEQKLIKSKPVGDLPINELKRIQKIVSDIKEVIQKYKINIGCIEGMAYGVRNATALVQLSALNYMVRAMLVEQNIPFIIVFPTTLKKFIASNGAAKKDEMLLSVFKRYGVTILDDNICDGYSLAQVGLALLEGNTKSITKIQQEVLDLLKKQI